MSFEIEVVSRPERLRELQAAWSERVIQAEGATPFQLPEWLLTWWNHFGSGDLQTIVGWFDGAIAGVVPCFLHTWDGARQLTLLGSGITDYLDPFIAVEHETLIIAAIRHHLEEADYDVCNWQDLSAGSPLLKLAEFRSLEVTVLTDTNCSEAELGLDFNAYWHSRSSDMRRNVRRYAEKAERKGPLNFVVDCSGDSGRLDALFTLHTARWRSRGETGMVEANRSGEFMREVSELLAKREALRLFALDWDGRPVAAILAFSWKRKMYGYFSAFDPDCEHLGFGRILLSKCIHYAIDTGHTHWNFLRGDEPYKKSWGAQCLPKYRLVIRRRATSGTT